MGIRGRGLYGLLWHAVLPAAVAVAAVVIVAVWLRVASSSPPPSPPPPPLSVEHQQPPAIDPSALRLGTYQGRLHRSGRSEWIVVDISDIRSSASGTRFRYTITSRFERAGGEGAISRDNQISLGVLGGTITELSSTTLSLRSNNDNGGQRRWSVALHMSE